LNDGWGRGQSPLQPTPENIERDLQLSPLDKEILLLIRMLSAKLGTIEVRISVSQREQYMSL
jgi:hypothetical protein